VQNAIDLAHALGIPEPKVALLSAVRRSTPRFKSTLDAAALCKMADRGQDHRRHPRWAASLRHCGQRQGRQDQGLVSPVTGQADILVVPDLESGNMLAKQRNIWAERRWPHRARRARPHHPHQPRRFCGKPGSPVAPWPCCCTMLNIRWKRPDSQPNPQARRASSPPGTAPVSFGSPSTPENPCLRVGIQSPARE